MSKKHKLYYPFTLGKRKKSFLKLLIFNPILIFDFSTLRLTYKVLGYKQVSGGRTDEQTDERTDERTNGQSDNVTS